jgi:hypothetical protein
VYAECHFYDIANKKVEEGAEEAGGGGEESDNSG